MISECENLNHRRSGAPVGHCPECGEVVNPQIRAAPCTEDAHAEARRRRSTFCVDCGARLISAR